MDLGAFSLKGKRALVTGASRGIGRAIAEGLAGAGAAVIVASRSRDRLGHTLAAIRSKGGHAEPVAFDASKAAACRQGVAEAARLLGGLDILVNNAGVE